MFSKKFNAAFCAHFFLLLSPQLIFGMEGTPEPIKPIEAPQMLESKATLKDLANIYWPDSNATELQQEETLKNLLGKKVNWEITVAQIQRDGDSYLIQGQSSKDMLGTFSYVAPKTEAEKEAIIKAQIGSKLDISGVVNDMQMRHIVLKPANIIIK